MTKEDFFASIMNSETQHPRDPSRPKRQSRMSREIVSSSELRDNLTRETRFSSASCRQLDARHAYIRVARPPL